MSAADIVERAAALGVSLWIEGGHIGIEGPARSVAAIRPELAACKPEVMAYLLKLRQGEKLPAAGGPPARGGPIAPPAIPDDSAGALVSQDGGLYLPWGYIEAGNVQRLRAELFAMIDELARAEAWTPECYSDTMSRAANGPLSDLLDNIAHFHARVIELRADAESRSLLAARSWRYQER